MATLLRTKSNSLKEPSEIQEGEGASSISRKCPNPKQIFIKEEDGIKPIIPFKPIRRF